MPVALVSLNGSDTAGYALPWECAFATGLDLRLVLLVRGAEQPAVH